MGDCLFCAIASKDIPSAALHEDEATFAFLDINPLTRGHALVIPKAHGARLDDLTPEAAAAVMASVQKLVRPVCQAAGAADATIAINDGPDAGQEVPHVHVHIIPRLPGDSGGAIHSLFGERPHVDGDELATFAGRVKDLLEGA